MELKQCFCSLSVAKIIVSLSYNLLRRSVRYAFDARTWKWKPHYDQSFYSENQLFLFLQLFEMNLFRLAVNFDILCNLKYQQWKIQTQIFLSQNVFLVCRISPSGTKKFRKLLKLSFYSRMLWILEKICDVLFCRIYLFLFQLLQTERGVYVRFN